VLSAKRFLFSQAILCGIRSYCCCCCVCCCCSCCCSCYPLLKTIVKRFTSSCCPSNLSLPSGCNINQFDSNIVTNLLALSLSFFLSLFLSIALTCCVKDKKKTKTLSSVGGQRQLPNCCFSCLLKIFRKCIQVLTTYICECMYVCVCVCVFLSPALS